VELVNEHRGTESENLSSPLNRCTPKREGLESRYAEKKESGENALNFSKSGESTQKRRGKRDILAKGKGRTTALLVERRWISGEAKKRTLGESDEIENKKWSDL